MLKAALVHCAVLVQLAAVVVGWCSSKHDGDCFVMVRAGGVPSESAALSRGISFVHRPDDARPDEEAFAHIAAVPDAGAGQSEMRFALGDQVHARLLHSGVFAANRLQVGSSSSSSSSSSGAAEAPFVLKVVGDGGLVIAAATGETDESPEPHAWTLRSVAGKASGLHVAEGSVRVVRLASGAPKDSVVVSAEGNVGIGTPWPTVKLDVNGGVQGTSAYSSASDARYKTNVQELGARECQQKVAGLRPVSFDWRRRAWPAKQFEQGEQIGFVAQEVEKLVPQVVSVDADGMRSVKYAALTPLLVGAVQHLSDQLDRLQRELELLRQLPRAQQSPTF